MKRIAVILGLTYVAFLIEFVLYNTFGPWGKPELLILSFVFFNLYLGIRYSIIAALAAGLLRDAFGAVPLGEHIFIYVLGAYWTTVVSKYIYQPGSKFSRAMVAFFVVVFCFALTTSLHSFYTDLRIEEIFIDVLFPQLITTMVASTVVFHRLRDICVFFKLKN